MSSTVPGSWSSNAVVLPDFTGWPTRPFDRAPLNHMGPAAQPHASPGPQDTFQLQLLAAAPFFEETHPPSILT